jgi:hypothetical protein
VVTLNTRRVGQSPFGPVRLFIACTYKERRTSGGTAGNSRVNFFYTFLNMVFMESPTFKELWDSVPVFLKIIPVLSHNSDQ